jgi:hypothetical protein
MTFLAQIVLGGLRMLVQPLLIAFGAIQAYKGKVAERGLQDASDRNEIDEEYRGITDRDELVDRVRRSQE